MGNYCGHCGKMVNKLWSVCHECLANLDGYKLFLEEKDLTEYCEALCELEFSFNKPGNEAYFDFFMLFKSLFDVISYHVYNDGPIIRIAEYYKDIYAFFILGGRRIYDKRLHGRMGYVLQCVKEPLERQGVLKSIDYLTRATEVVEKEKREQHLKSQLWWLGTTINIRLRGNFAKNDLLTRNMLDLLALVRKGIYGPEDIDNLREPFKEFKREWENVKIYYENIDDLWTTPLLSNMETSLKGITKVLNE